METTTQRIRLEVDTQADVISTWAEHFLTDRKVSNAAKGMLFFYQWKLQNFIDYCTSQGVENISELSKQKPK